MHSPDGPSRALFSTHSPTCPEVAILQLLGQQYASALAHNDLESTSKLFSPCIFVPLSILSLQNLGWAGYIRVDNVTWVWLGGIITNVPKLNLSIPVDLQVTPTRTIYTLQAGPMDVRVTFLSPIEVRSVIMHSRYPC